MKLRAALLLALATVGLSLVVTISPAQPAWACSCAWSPGAEQDQHAEQTVFGTVAQVTDESIRLVVDAVEKGDVAIGETLGLRVGRSEASCGYEFRAGVRYRVNVHNGTTGLCNGVLPAPPSPSPSEPAASAAAVVATPALAEPAADRAPSTWWLAAGAVLVVLAAGTVAWRRHRQSAPVDR